jgi:lysophospholipase L1-like esterase
MNALRRVADIFILALAVAAPTAVLAQVPAPMPAVATNAAPAIMAPAISPPLSPAVSDHASSATGSVSTADNRWDASFAAFAADDKAHAPTPGGVLFVGSSSIRLWDGLETDFKSLPVVVKRGFGGSRMFDCAQYLRRLVVPYQPRLVLVYAGDNDLAEGRSPQDVLKSFMTFVEGVRQSLPATRIAYISVKPSPSRIALMPKIRETNALIQAYTEATPNTDFIDVFSAMLNPAGQPRMELFRADALHLNPVGYALWTQIISTHLN